MLERRRKLREDSRRLIEEEVKEMERDLAQVSSRYSRYSISDPSFYLMVLTPFEFMQNPQQFNYVSSQTEGPHRELLVLSRERRVLVLQMEALRAEAQQAERDLQSQHLTHQTELQQLRDESLQVRSANSTFQCTGCEKCCFFHI